MNNWLVENFPQNEVVQITYIDIFDNLRCDMFAFKRGNKWYNWYNGKEFNFKVIAWKYIDEPYKG